MKLCRGYKARRDPKRASLVYKLDTFVLVLRKYEFFNLPNKVSRISKGADLSGWEPMKNKEII